MRVLCVGRHPFLSEHLCRYFGALGAECAPVVGTADVVAAAARVEPHLVVCQGDLLSPALLDGWSTDPALRDVPVLAVSLTPAVTASADTLTGSATSIYLPALDRAQARALLVGAYRPRGVPSPEWRLGPPSASAVTRPA